MNNKLLIVVFEVLMVVTEEYGLDVVSFGESPTFITTPSSTVDMEALSSFEIPGVSRIARRYNPEDRTLHMFNS
jgi:hypothetical protein